MTRILIIGATSAIAEAVARRYAGRAATFALTGRDGARLDAIAADLKVRGASSVSTHHLDLNDLADHERVLESVQRSLGGLDVVLVAHGTLPDQAACEKSVELSLAEFATNGTSTIALCTRVANRLGPGATLAVISSVAGDRGRASNYVYGSAKAAVSAFLSGLRQRLNRAGVNVLTIKPGFVDTPMTGQFSKGALWARPDTVAHGIVRAIDSRRAVAYVPAFWYFIMFAIRHVPETIFRRLRL